MIDRLMRRTALALTAALLPACNEEMTEPETEVSGVTAPELTALSGSWTTKADMPGTARGGAATAMVRNAQGQSILYVIGGRLATGGSLGRVQAYNVATNTWTWKAEWPVAAYNTNGAGVINGKIYITGGETKDKIYRNELYMYDPASNTWSRKHDMPHVTWGGITGVINNQLYVLTCEAEEECYINNAPLVLYRYDPATDQWTDLGLSPRQDRRPMGGTIGGKLYFTGAASLTNGGALLTVYDPATNQWTRKTPMNHARFSGAGATLGGKLYIFGGTEVENQTFTQVRTVNVYNPVTDSWSKAAPMPTLRSGYTAERVLLNGKARIEVVGGSKPGNNLQFVS